MTLQQIALPIEAAVCLLDRELDYRMTDSQARGVFEILLDIWAFGESPDSLAPRIRELRCARVVDMVERELGGQDRAQVAKVLGASWFTTNRRDAGGRHHLDILQEFTAPHLG